MRRGRAGAGRRAGITPADAARFRAALAQRSDRQGLVEACLRAVIRASCRLVGWRVSVDRRAALPAWTTARPGSGCILAVAPHRNWLEPFLLLAAWPPDAAALVWLADGATVSRSWWRRHLLPRLGIVPVEGRFGGPGSYLQMAEAALRSGAAMVIFPEVGEPSTPDHIRDLAPGFAYAAIGCGAPVIPVVVAGTHAVMRGSRFGVTFLEATAAGEPAPDALSAHVRPRAHALAALVARRIEEALPGCNRVTDAALPRVARWRWLGSLFH
jgi:1-acyl-sn-glycerol-3-phosphate acyltransferase